MKKSLLLITGGILTTSGLFAQISLNQSSYTSSQIRTDSFKSTTAASTFPSFAPATNATWDLTTVTDSTGYTLIYRVPAISATFADSNYYSLGPNAYQGSVQSAIASGGYTQSGITVQAATYPIAGAGPNDSIYILAQPSTFTVPGSSTASPRKVIQFPATMGSTWTSNYETDFNYEVSYAPLYVHAPGKVKSYITETNTVIGWGKMKVKTGSGSASGFMNVLQVRTQTNRVDSFYLNGGVTDPGLSTLLGILGFTQGQESKTYTQNFFRLDEVSPLATVTFSDSANTTPTDVTTHKNRLAGPASVLNVNSSNDIQIYPNPLTGSELTVSIAAATGVWSYEMVNMTGQAIAADVLPLNNGQAIIKLTDVAAGIYFVRLSNDGRQITVKAIEVK